MAVSQSILQGLASHLLQTSKCLSTVILQAADLICDRTGSQETFYTGNPQSGRLCALNMLLASELDPLGFAGLLLLRGQCFIQNIELPCLLLSGSCLIIVHAWRAYIQGISNGKSNGKSC